MKLEWKTCLKVGVSVFLLYLCIQYWPNAANVLSAACSAATPLLVGCVIAYLVNILMRFYEGHYFQGKTTNVIVKSRRPVCMIAAFLTLIVILLLLINLIVPELISCVGVIISALAQTTEMIVDMLMRTNALPKDLAAALAGIDWQSKIEQLLSLLTTGAGTVVNAVINAASSMFSSLVTLLVGIIFSHLFAAWQR